MKKAFTLIEVIIVIVLFVILTAVTIYVFRAVLLSWSSQETRAGIDIALDRGIEEMVRDLRGAKAITYVNNDEIRFTAIGDTHHIYYLYDENDIYPPNFDQDSYQLRKATLSGSINGALVDAGRIIITDVLPPPTSDFLISGDRATIDISISRGDETIRSRTEVKPRNL
ncbi:MAG: prepilin-type N-terminal cleavage/methylation domain-containing protein [Candidatus Omnitrophica bacterium]|nr:prepilin-type N-terminal cleavage/methylation domain-containing protein [Candidatus Omnitrophota bacterium]